VGVGAGEEVDDAVVVLGEEALEAGGAVVAEEAGVGLQAEVDHLRRRGGIMEEGASTARGCARARTPRPRCELSAEPNGHRIRFRFEITAPE
jgi:hypothetical protein